MPDGHLSAVMNIQAQISLYPLRTSQLGQVIDRFLEELDNDAVTLTPGAMSTVVAGEADAVFAALQRGFNAVAGDDQVVMNVSVSNACPSCEPKQKMA